MLRQMIRSMKGAAMPSALLTALTAAILLTLLITSGCRRDMLPTGTVCHGQDCFKVEIVSTPETREIGLMNRTELAEDKGMLFVFQEYAIYPFWMKNTLIPLDMVWLDTQFNVVHIEEDVQPCEADPCAIINPRVGALYVLEFNAGTARRIGLTVGDSITPDSSILAGAKYLN